MINPDQLELLRCPFDYKRQTPLVIEDDHKVFCSRCRVQFKSRDGIINLITSDAILPDETPKPHLLPCHKK